MTTHTIYALGKSNISISSGGNLSGVSQGDGSHLQGLIITLNNNGWETVDVNDTDTDTRFGDSDSSQTLAGSQTFDGTTYSGTPRVEAEYELLLRDSAGNTYRVLGFNLNGPGGGATYGSVEGLAFVGGVGGFPPIGVSLTVIGTTEGPNVLYADLATPPCFATGCMIATADGPRRVETLVIGDWVTTLDHGEQQIKWAGSHRLPKVALVANPKFTPVLVRANAVGQGCPARDIRLSPQHRILVSGWQAELLFGEDEILVPVIKLINDHSILFDHISDGVTYYHIMFDQHEIVQVDGLSCESYLPGVCEVDAAETLREIVALFPELADQQTQAAARTCVSDKRAAVLGEMLGQHMLAVA